MSKNFEKVKNFHHSKYWPINLVIKLVGKWITAEEYWEITGDEFKKKVEE